MNTTEVGPIFSRKNATKYASSGRVVERTYDTRCDSDGYLLRIILEIAFQEGNMITDKLTL